MQKNRIIDTIEGNGQHWAKALIKERIGDLLYLQVKSWDSREFNTLKEAHGEEIAPGGYHTSKSNMHS